MPTLTLVSERTPLQTYEINSLAVAVGRAEDMDIVIDNVSVSRKQAAIRLGKNGRWTVEDLGSSNGTFLNGERLMDAQALTRGDEISFGKFSLFFDRNIHEPISDTSVTRKNPAGSATDTYYLDANDVERLQRSAAQKRRAHLHWEAKGKQDTFYMDRAESTAVVIGRSELCDVRVPVGPKHHLIVMRIRTRYEVRNLSGWHRMWVNGEAREQAMLKTGDVIEVGRLRITFFDEVG